jgi:hypothetical protein
MNDPSHIVPLMVGDPVLCKQIGDVQLSDYRIDLQPINHPTLPRGAERQRITPSPLQTEQDIDHLVGALSAIWSELRLKRAGTGPESAGGAPSGGVFGSQSGKPGIASRSARSYRARGVSLVPLRQPYREEWRD